jgi:hypothetical protein
MTRPITLFAFLLLLGYLSGSFLLTCGQSRQNKNDGLALVGAMLRADRAATEPSAFGGKSYSCRRQLSWKPNWKKKCDS